MAVDEFWYVLDIIAEKTAMVLSWVRREGHRGHPLDRYHSLCRFNSDTFGGPLTV